MMRREINFSVPVIIRIIEIPWHQCAINWVTALLLRVNGTCRLSFCYLNIFCQANKKYTQKNITPSRFICYWAKKHASIKKIQIFSNCKEIVRPPIYFLLQCSQNSNTPKYLPNTFDRKCDKGVLPQVVRNERTFFQKSANFNRIV